jgi:XTP/dITP diphosphohydrolase
MARVSILTMRILIATSNAGKLRDFAGAARPFGIEVDPLPGLESLPAPAEDQPTFEGNARKKAEHYSRAAPGELVLADDSGLEVDALHGAPGIYSARYAALERASDGNSSDAENNARLLRELGGVDDARRTARFVCVIAAARDGGTQAVFHGSAQGVILRQARGSGGFGYDPLFYFPAIDRTFAELPPEEKATYSHRGQAFRKFLNWMQGHRNSKP